MFVSNTSNLASAGQGYSINNSLRLRANSSAYLTRTLSVTSTSSKTLTWSGWIKRGALGSARAIIAYHGNSGGNNNMFEIEFAADTLRAYFDGGGVTGFQTTSVYRDTSAWYHIVVNYDSTQATSSNRAKVYVNGVQVTSFSSVNYPALNQAIDASATNVQYIGAGVGPVNFLDGYISEVNFIDGQQLDASYFGTTNSDGVWTPKAYTGTYGTNGFYLKFNDGSNLTNLCLDRSGNGNNWTATNVSLTAGVTYDLMVDTPTNNYATLSPISLTSTARGAITNGNLTASLANLSTSSTIASLGMTSGKWYWEVTQTYNAQGVYVGIDSNPFAISTSSATIAAGGLSTGYGYYNGNGNKANNAASLAYGTAWYSTGTYVIGVYFDADAGTLGFKLNNVDQGTAFTGLTSGPYFPSGSNASGTSGPTTLEFNFGQRPFTYTPPTGFKALCTSNLPTVGIVNGRKHFDVLTHTGNGSTQNVTGTQFQPDFVWVKARGSALGHVLQDSIRGAGKALYSNSTTAETGNAGDVISSFNSNGITVNTNFLGGSDNGTNGNALAFVDYLWKAGGSAVTNTAGTITSQVSVNSAAGFSIVTYTGTGANATVGHGLGVAPSLIITKTRNTALGNWGVYHKSLGATQAMNMNLTIAAFSGVVWWNNTAPTSSVFSIGTSNDVNGASTYVAYCFAEVPGFSKISSYTGNGSADGPFVFCGFRPRWVMYKRTDSATDWVVVDAARSPANAVSANLFPNLSNAEGTAPDIDFTANGFKIRVAGVTTNASGGTYIFMALAENPFGGSNAAPATAR